MKPDAPTTGSPAPDTDGTAAMAAELAALVNTGNPRDYYHWNSKRAAMMLPQVQQTPMPQKVSIWFNYCVELLQSGNPGQVIQEIEAFLQGQQQPYSALLSDNTRPIFELLAMAYLRLGEQENCLARPHPDACIFPLRAGGRYQLETGSRKAMELYTLLLSKYDDPKYRWLLNLAAMTIGEYPQGVPAALRVAFPSTTLESTDFPRFADVAAARGAALNGLSGGVCVDDFNGDGRFDIFATSYGMGDAVQLLVQDATGNFKRAADTGLDGITSGLNAVHADYNNDGHPDVLVLRGGWLGKAGAHPNSLLRNNGDGTFSDVTRSSGLYSKHPTQTAAWADVNLDGHLDLFIGNESKKGDPHPCELYVSRGDGTFREQAAQYGLAGITAFVKGTAFGDVDNDGRPDLYLSINGAPNRLYRNTGSGFVEQGAAAGVQEPIFSFPTWFFDANQDGYQDLFVSGYDVRNQRNLAGDYARELLGQPVASEKPRLYLNNQNGTFREASKTYGLDRTLYTMGSNYGDLDNDGYPDFYAGTGAPDFSTLVPNRMFVNRGGKRFEEVTSVGGFGHIQKGHGVAFADLDADGDQDVYAVMGGAFEGDVANNVLFDNPGIANRWIAFDLRGTQTNRSAIGTRIELELPDGSKRYHWVSTGGSFGSQPLRAQIGLGKAKQVTKATFYWPVGQPQTLTDLAAGQVYTVVQE